MFYKSLLPLFLLTAQTNASDVTSESLIKTMHFLNATIMSCNAASDCEVLAMGKRACGGPQDYLVVSNANVHLPALIVLAEASEILEDESNRDSGGVSICAFVTKPQVECLQNQCVVQE